VPLSEPVRLRYSDCNKANANIWEDFMRSISVSKARLAAGVAIAVLSLGGPGRAQAPAPLSGQVSSTEEGAMEGVLVSAKRDGSTITVSVVTDAQGHYQFPPGRLDPGHYKLTIRATGYDLGAPAATDIDAAREANVDLKLRKTKRLAAQLNNAEWLASMPGTDDQKKSIFECTNCHSLQRIVMSQHDAGEFLQVFKRMSGYTFSSTSLKPQLRKRPITLVRPEVAQQTADFLAAVDLSQDETWAYPLKVLPRVSGRSTRVVITEYDMPREVTQPHDVLTDADGMLWFSYFGEQFLGKLDPKTGQVTEIPIPTVKPGWAEGTLDLKRGPDGSYWIGMMYQTGLAKFDPKENKFEIIPLPAELNSDVAQQSMVMPVNSAADGKVWTNNAGARVLLRLDLATRTWEAFEPFKGITGAHQTYGIASDSKNNIYFMDFADKGIGKIDAKTGKNSLFPAPTAGRPRRGTMDTEDRLWFAEWTGDRIGMFDTKAETFKEWQTPTPWTAPYDVVSDKNGEAWTAGMNSDRVVRLDPKTGNVTEYPLPKFTNIRKVYVDNSTTPVTFWAGSNHGASIVRVEPLD
jgi:virginiamycin B lyase